MVSINGNLRGFVFGWRMMRKIGDVWMIVEDAGRRP